MKKKIIALIMIIPIVFLIALFSVGKAAGVYADIPVTGIQITTQNEDGFIDVDVADYEPIAFLAQVQPVNARNQKYSFEISGVGGEAPDGFEIIDGKLYIDNVGKVKITAISAEKGFKDSVIVSAYSTKVLRIYPKVNGDEITSDVVSIDGGENVFSAELYPENLSGETRIFEEIGDNHILKLNAVTGVAQALFSGETQVRITCPEGREGLEKVLTVKVNVDTDSTGFAVNGKSSGAKVTVKNKATTAKLFVESKNDALEISDLTLPEGVTASGIERISENKFVLTLSFDKEFSDEENSGKVGATDFSLEFTEYNLDVRTSYYDGEGDEIKQKNNTKVTYVAYSESDDDADVKFEIIRGADVITLEQHGQFANITATKRDFAKIKITAEHDGKVIKEIEKTIRVVPNVYSMEFADSAKEYGIENILTIGGRKPNGRADTRTIFVRVVTEAGAETFKDEFMNVAFFADDDSLFSCKAQTATNADAISAEIRAKGTGLTTLNAELKNYNQYFGTNICAKIRLRAVKDGRNVGNYEELKTVTEAGHIVVLKNNVMLGVKSDGMDMTEDELKKDVKKFTTTYDKTYLENSGESKEVQYLIEFRNHVYGNGFEINADKFTQCKDATGVPKIFKGPLNFVAISSASVKGQDNISFLVRTDNVLINNVVLKGCSDDSLLEEDGRFNLSKLNYVGTTLEIAKSAKLLNSRVSNGRTVVRIFAGGSTMGSPVVEDKSAFNVQEEKINVHIESCVLSNAREFILKIGSNRALKQTSNKQRELLDASGKAYSPYDEKNKTDKYFNDNYLINDVTLKNSVLDTSGLFSVGMETHFSGVYLYDGFSETWKGCAATSYASALRIVGDVKMLDWKNLSNVDSSTLIEVTGDANPLLSMNVAEMMKEVAKVKEECRDIILNVGGTEYVHGGIAFYGGGYNYSYLDLTEANDETKQFGVYDVNISVLENSKDENIRNQGKILPYAAGAGDFRFYLYNNKSSRNLSWQENIKYQESQGMKIHPVVAEDVE